MTRRTKSTPWSLNDHERSPKVVVTHDDSWYDPSSLGGRNSKQVPKGVLIMPPKRSVSRRNATKMPPQTRMQSRNGPCTPVQGSSVGVQDGLTISGRVPDTSVSQPPIGGCPVRSSKLTTSQL
ncbi:hypothetical protein HAX54_013746 [Datura stramonium]|uniref:Uncharacterized protein n=1 Tax=Datura stramonium TaxID=4076 RepID=A0ABS8TNJ5_DATST|nr:hypothetical protein [Datura stramonium]